MQRLPRWHILLSLFFCLCVALAPSLADARAGRSFGGSGVPGIGSRGARTFEPNAGQGITRSTTPEPQAGTPFGAPSPAYGGSFFQRHPFLTGLFGGFLGSWLFGGGFFGHAFGGLLTILFLGFLIVLVMRLFVGRGFSFAGAGFAPRSVGAAAAPAGRFRGRDVAVADADLSAFQAIHAAIQEAWSRGDLARLRQLTTPEMLGYFSEELTKNASQGVQNIVSEVNLVKGDVSESWEEGDLQYATAFMRWSALDYIVRVGRSPSDPDYLVSGNPRTPIESEEMWTFARRRGGQWILSAVQQV